MVANGAELCRMVALYIYMLIYKLPYSSIKSLKSLKSRRYWKLCVLVYRLIRSSMVLYDLEKYHLGLNLNSPLQSLMVLYAHDKSDIPTSTCQEWHVMTCNESKGTHLVSHGKSDKSKMTSQKWQLKSDKSRATGQEWNVKRSKSRETFQEWQVLTSKTC